MARTRAEIQALVKSHVGWTSRTDKDTVIDSLCDSALKYAVMEHDFKDLTTITSSESEVTQSDTDLDLSSFSPSVFKIITARLLRVTNTTDAGYYLPLKDRSWWDRFVIDPEANSEGAILYGQHKGSTLYFDRPIEDDWKIRLRYTSISTYTADDIETPSELLDLFVEYKVTADLFFDLEDLEKFALWNRRAIGNNPEFPGGELGRAIRADQRNAGVEVIATRGRDLILSSHLPIAITTNDLDWTGSSPHTQLRTWI